MYIFGPYLHTCESNYLEVLPKYDHQITVKTGCLGNLKTLTHYVCTYLCEYHIISSSHPAFCDSWKNLSTVSKHDFSLDFCEIPELKSCGFHKLHACKQHTFERRLCGPFLLHAYVPVVVDWRPCELFSDISEPFRSAETRSCVSLADTVALALKLLVRKKLLRPVAVISVVAVCFLRLIAERSESESSNRGYLSQVASRPTRI